MAPRCHGDSSKRTHNSNRRDPVDFTLNLDPQVANMLFLAIAVVACCIVLASFFKARW